MAGRHFLLAIALLFKSICICTRCANNNGNYPVYTSAPANFDVHASTRLTTYQLPCERANALRNLDLMFVFPQNFRDKTLFNLYQTLITPAGTSYAKQKIMENFGTPYYSIITDTYGRDPIHCMTSSTATAEHWTALNSSSWRKTWPPPPRYFPGDVLESSHLYRILSCVDPWHWNVNFPKPWIHFKFEPNDNTIKARKGRTRVVIILADRIPFILRQRYINTYTYASTLQAFFRKLDISILYIVSDEVYSDYFTLLRELNLDYSAIRKAQGSLVETIISGLYDISCQMEYKVKNTGLYAHTPFSYQLPYRKYQSLNLKNYEIVLSIVEDSQLYPVAARFVHSLQATRLVDTWIELLKIRYPAISFVVVRTSDYKKIPSRLRLNASEFQSKFDVCQPIYYNELEYSRCDFSAKSASNLMQFRTIGSFYQLGTELTSTYVAEGKKRIGIHVIFVYDFPFRSFDNTVTVDKFENAVSEKGDYVIYVASNKCTGVKQKIKYDYDVVEAEWRSDVEIMTDVTKLIDDRLSILDYSLSYTNDKQLHEDLFAIPKKLRSMESLELHLMFPKTQSPKLAKLMHLLAFQKSASLRFMMQKWPIKKLSVSYSFYGDHCSDYKKGCYDAEHIEDIKNTDLYFKNMVPTVGSIETISKNNALPMTFVQCATTKTSADLNAKTFIIAFVEAEQSFYSITYDEELKLQTSKEKECSAVDRGVALAEKRTLSAVPVKENNYIHIIKTKGLSDDFDFHLARWWPTARSTIMNPYDNPITTIYKALSS